MAAEDTQVVYVMDRKEKRKKCAGKKKKKILMNTMTKMCDEKKNTLEEFVFFSSVI